MPAVTRRDALLTGTAGLLLAGWPALAAQIKTSLPKAFIDAHCHVFNAHDIPVPQFLLDTAMRETDQPLPWIIAGSIFANAIKIYMDFVDPEAGLADGQFALTSQLPSKAAEDAEFQKLLEQAIRMTAAQASLGPPSPTNPSERSLTENANKHAPNFLLLPTPGGSVTMNPAAAGLLYLLDHYGLKSANTMRRTAGSKRFLRAETLKPGVSDSDINLLALRLNTEALKQDTDLGSIWALAKTVTRRRASNIRDLDTSLGVAAVKPECVRFYAPAMVDFDCWYTQILRSLSLDKQTKVMAALAKRQPNPNLLVHGYVPFDPLRMVLWEEGLVGGTSPFETVKAAITQRGFIGVKLYPPMGFKPINNAALANTDFGPHVHEWTDRIAAHPGKRDFKLGPRLDAALDKIYRFCLKNDVPILAHCADSQASFAGSAERANPEFWLQVLNRKDGGADGRFNMLRLNLGHFGGLWCHGHTPKQSGDAYSEEARCWASRTWTDTVVDAMTKVDAQRAPLYPNLYCDIGDLAELVDDGQAGKRIQDFLSGHTAEQKAALQKRVLYGTDWMFLVLAGKSYTGYVDAVNALCGAFGGTSADVLHANAARFFGLTHGGPSFNRLVAFYGNNPARLHALDVLAAI